MQQNRTLQLGLVLTSSLLLQACGSSSNSSNDPVTKDVVLDTTAPSLTQLLPNNNKVVQSSKVMISGQVSDDNALKSVVVTNGNESITAELEGDRFTALISAGPGRNTYSVVATDDANNATTVSENFYFGSRVSAGGAHSGAIKNKRIYAWGRNNEGQAGIGFITSMYDKESEAKAVHPMIPTLISVPVNDASDDETKFASLVFNSNASSALDVNGHVWSWGSGSSGQLGLGVANDNIIDDVDHTSPQKINGLSDIVAISRGGGHCLLLNAEGTVLAFGNNSQGQLGDGSTDDKDSPVVVNGLSNIVQISASAASYAIDQDGRLWGWGSNEDGQLANGVSDVDAHSIPTQIMIDEPVVGIASGNGHALALTESGKVYAWGLNFSSQVGMQVSKEWDDMIYTPKLLPWFDDAIAVWAKGNQSFVQRADGKVYPWGQNMLGTLGIELDDDVEKPNSPINNLENVADLGSGALHTLALRNDGQVFSWGWNFEGSLGAGKEMLNRWGYRVPLSIVLPE